jgi:hypothetical protein
MSEATEFGQVENEVPDVNEIVARAAEVPFLRTVGRGIAAALLFLFAAIGWVFGSLWFSVVFLFLWIRDALIFGFRKGAHTKTKPKRTPSLPA